MTLAEISESMQKAISEAENMPVGKWHRDGVPVGLSADVFVSKSTGGKIQVR